MFSSNNCLRLVTLLTYPVTSWISVYLVYKIVWKSASKIQYLQIQFTSWLKPLYLNTHIISKSNVIDPNKCKVFIAVASYLAQKWLWICKIKELISLINYVTVYYHSNLVLNKKITSILLSCWILLLRKLQNSTEERS